MRMACFVYILGSNGKGGFRTYVGWTLDVERRLVQHNAGKGARSTRGRAWVLLHVERHRTQRSAMSREWYLKRDRLFRKELRLAFESEASGRSEIKTPGKTPGALLRSAKAPRRRPSRRGGYGQA